MALINNIIFYILVLLIAAAIGSFLTVVIYRLPKIIENAESDASLLENTKIDNKIFNLWWPRSHCPHCNHVLKIWHNIPLISYWLLKRQCAHCHQPISREYFLIELFTVIISVICAAIFGCSTTLIAILIASWLLIAIAIIDLKHWIIPDSLNYGLLWSGLLFTVFGWIPDMTSAESILGVVIGYVALWLLSTLFYFIRKKEGMGQGDWKLLAALGAWVGWRRLPSLLLIASVAALIYAIAQMIYQRKNYDGTRKIPFGPFLALGGFIILLSYSSFD